jgi:hypothetical protein
LTGTTGANGERVETCEFLCESFQPDYEHPARINRIQLIKGVAIQHSLPRTSTKTIDITAVTRRTVYADAGNVLDHGDILRRLYYTNNPEAPAPFPTDFLAIRRDYLILREPDGEEYKVRFADAPRETIVTGTRHRLLKTWQLRFFYVGDDIENFL